MYRLAGYLDSKAIGSGVLVPIYQDQDSQHYFIHQTDPSFKTITKFEHFDPAEFPHNEITFAQTAEELTDIGGPAALVVKIRNDVHIGRAMDGEFITQVQEKAEQENVKPILKTLQDLRQPA